MLILSCVSEIATEHRRHPDRLWPDDSEDVVEPTCREQRVLRGGMWTDWHTRAGDSLVLSLFQGGRFN
jgi:hypothetical protein